VKLTDGQSQALAGIQNLQKQFPDGGGIGVISGYAGTGKTTLIRVLGEEHQDGLLVITPTGKAALRVKEAAEIEDARTIHSWLYEVSEDEKTGQLGFNLRKVNMVTRPGSGLVLVDEASMMGLVNFRDVYRYCQELNLNLVLIGDSFQLPPVEPEAAYRDFSVFSDSFPSNFKVKLTEVLRQALDSPVIKACTAIRNGGRVHEALAEIPGVSPGRLTEEARRVWDDQGATICHKNATRHVINSAIRQQLGLSDGQLQDREPLLVTRNNYQVGLYNGEVVDVLGPPEAINAHPIAVRDRFKGGSCFVNCFWVKVNGSEGKVKVLVADREIFGTAENVGEHIIRRACQDLFPGRKDDPKPPYLHSNLGYALTCHKSQGSEWDEVLVVMESSVRLNTEDGRRWAYTAVSRAQREVKICWR